MSKTDLTPNLTYKKKEKVERKKIDNAELDETDYYFKEVEKETGKEFVAAYETNRKKEEDAFLAEQMNFIDMAKRRPAEYVLRLIHLLQDKIFDINIPLWGNVELIPVHDGMTIDIRGKRKEINFTGIVILYYNYINSWNLGIKLSFNPEIDMGACLNGLIQLESTIDMDKGISLDGTDMDFNKMMKEGKETEDGLILPRGVTEETEEPEEETDAKEEKDK